MLAEGANVNVQDNGGWTAVILAAWNGRSDILHILLAKGAEVNAKDDHGQTALMHAEEFGHGETAELLREAATRR